MQDIHSIENINNTAGGGGGRRLFAGVEDKRLRPPHHHHHHHHHHNHHNHHDLKCPRCDSSNTKFCYYNNYNLSQPRHFCKACRRYWTNGGVLRNVPVGGGVRKAKRSAKSKSNSKSTTVPSSSSSAVTVTDSVTVPLDPSDLERKSSNSENSSSDSSSRTANTTVTATPVTTNTTTETAEVSRCNSTNSNSPMLFNIPQSATQFTTVDPSILKQSCGGNKSSEIGTFRSLIKSWNDEGIQKTENDQVQIQMERDWEDNEGLFDQSYWSQNQWNDDHHNLLNYLP